MIENLVHTVTTSALSASAMQIELANPQEPFALPYNGHGYALLMKRESSSTGTCKPVQIEVIEYDGYEADGVTLKVIARGVGNTDALAWPPATVVQQPFLKENYADLLDDLDALIAFVIRNALQIEKDYQEFKEKTEGLSGRATSLEQRAESADKKLKEQESLKQDIEKLTFASWSQFEYLAELNRLTGQSGVVRARKYEHSGVDAFNQPTHTGYTPINGHEHSNIKNLVGTGEFAVMINGVLYRFRHNDDGLYMPCVMGDDYNNRQVINIPSLPADIAALTDPAAQIALAKKYIQAWAGIIPSTSVANFADSAQWVLECAEVYPEIYYADQSLKDPFPGHRHQINVDTLPELFSQEQIYNLGGIKNLKENSLLIAAEVIDVDENNRPIVVLWRYRFISAPVGSIADYAINDLLEYHEDIVNSYRFNLTTEQMLNRRVCRFRVKQRKGQPDIVGNYSQPTLLDELIAKIPGLDGYGNTLTESYDGYNLLEFGKTTPLKSGYYNRWYAMSAADASNRRIAMRGFSDDKLWVAKTTQPTIKQTKFGNVTAGFSYLIPLELHFVTFLNGNFNPYELTDVSSQYTVEQMQAMYAAGQGKTQANPMPGYNTFYFYSKNPAELFSGAAPRDAADTTVSGGLWIKCADGQARNFHESGYGYFWPTSDLTGNLLRTRYPIYFAHHEGTESYKYHSAAMQEIQVVMTRLIGDKMDYEEDRLIYLDEINRAKNDIAALRKQADALRTKSPLYISKPQLSTSVLDAPVTNLPDGTTVVTGYKTTTATLSGSASLWTYANPAVTIDYYWQKPDGTSIKSNTISLANSAENAGVYIGYAQDSILNKSETVELKIEV